MYADPRDTSEVAQALPRNTPSHTANVAIRDVKFCSISTVIDSESLKCSGGAVVISSHGAAVDEWMT